MNKTLGSVASSVIKAFQKRFHPRDESGFLSRWMNHFGQADVGGVRVTEDNALTFLAVFTAVRIIAETGATLPLNTLRRLPGMGKELALDHPLELAAVPAGSAVVLLHGRTGPLLLRQSYRGATSQT